MKEEDKQELCKKHGIVYFISEGCKRCAREGADKAEVAVMTYAFKYHLKKTYAITSEEYLNAWSEQKGLCKSCGLVPGKRRLSVCKGKAGNLYLVCSHCDVTIRTGKNNRDACRFLALYVHEL